MESSCVRHNLIPGTSRLFLDYLYNFDRVERFYSAGWEAEQVAETARALRFPEERRKQLVGIWHRRPVAGDALDPQPSGASGDDSDAPTKPD